MACILIAGTSENFVKETSSLSGCLIGIIGEALFLVTCVSNFVATFVSISFCDHSLTALWENGYSYHHET